MGTPRLRVMRTAATGSCATCHNVRQASAVSSTCTLYPTPPDASTPPAARGAVGGINLAGCSSLSAELCRDNGVLEPGLSCRLLPSAKGWWLDGLGLAGCLSCCQLFPGSMENGVGGWVPSGSLTMLRSYRIARCCSSCGSAAFAIPAMLRSASSLTAGWWSDLASAKRIGTTPRLAIRSRFYGSADSALSADSTEQVVPYHSSRSAG